MTTTAYALPRTARSIATLASIARPMTICVPADQTGPITAHIADADPAVVAARTPATPTNAPQPIGEPSGHAIHARLSRPLLRNLASTYTAMDIHRLYDTWAAWGEPLGAAWVIDPTHEHAVAYVAAEESARVCDTLMACDITHYVTTAADWSECILGMGYAGTHDVLPEPPCYG